MTLMICATGADRLGQWLSGCLALYGALYGDGWVSYRIAYFGKWDRSHVHFSLDQSKKSLPSSQYNSL